jgi:hypothetical protein
LSNPHQHREAGSSSNASGFAGVLRGARYDTEFFSLPTVLERCRQDDVVIGELSAYLRLPGNGTELVALRLRQRARDAHVSLSWQTGKVAATAGGTALDRDAWDALTTLEWTFDEKCRFILESWARVVDALGAEERAALPAQLPRSA